MLWGRSRSEDALAELSRKRPRGSTTSSISRSRPGRRRRDLGRPRSSERHLVDLQGAFPSSPLSHGRGAEAAGLETGVFAGVRTRGGGFSGVEWAHVSSMRTYSAAIPSIRSSSSSGCVLQRRRGVSGVRGQYFRSLRFQETVGHAGRGLRVQFGQPPPYRLVENEGLRHALVDPGLDRAGGGRPAEGCFVRLAIWRTPLVAVVEEALVELFGLRLLCGRVSSAIWSCRVRTWFVPRVWSPM